MNFFNLLFLGKYNFYHKTHWYEALFAKVVGAGRKLIAKFLKIKGNTLVWNQLCDVENPYSSSDSITYNSTNHSYTATYAEGSSSSASTMFAVPTTTGHKYLVRAKVISATEGWQLRCLPPTQTTTTYLYPGSHAGLFGDGEIFTASDGSLGSFRIGKNGSFTTAQTVTFIPQVFDLTQMGLDNLTVQEFNALFPLNYYQFDSGSLLNFNGEGIKTVGFNQWDEEWELGTIASATGQNSSSTTIIRAKNYIPILPNTQYYVHNAYGSNIYWFFYDGEQNYLNQYGNGNDKTVTTPSNAHYMRFRWASGYGTTYRDDTCINISVPSKNGTYEPYTSSTTSLPISTYFPTGMKSAGSVYDELTNSKAVTRIGVADLGSFNWTMFSVTQGNLFRSPNLNPIGYALSYDSVNLKCALYPTVKASQRTDDSISVGSNNCVDIIDSTYSDATAFKNAMNGVMLYYELATPTEVTIDPPLELNYQIWEGGTEQLLPVNTDNPTTSPILADIKYPDGERDNQYFTYRQYLPNSRMMSMALNTIMGKSVEFNQEALDILMKGE